VRPWLLLATTSALVVVINRVQTWGGLTTRCSRRRASGAGWKSRGRAPAAA